MHDEILSLSFKDLPPLYDWFEFAELLVFAAKAVLKKAGFSHLSSANPAEKGHR